MRPNRRQASSHLDGVGLKSCATLWERACRGVEPPRTPAQPVPATASSASRACPLPQGTAQTRGSRCTCGSWLAGDWAAQQPRMQPERR